MSNIWIKVILLSLSLLQCIGWILLIVTILSAFTKSVAINWDNITAAAYLIFGVNVVSEHLKLRLIS